jgi:KUP system potassium uptake protein
LSPSSEDGKSAARKRGTAALALGALGIVFGDIGTSPLYALQAVFSTELQVLRPDRASVYGVISLVFWTITLVVSVKYVAFIMRADNKGEGGIMALIGLVRTARFCSPFALPALVALGMLGAALFYGDSTITPAISVLSAVEGIKIAEPGVSSLVVPIALVVLTLLFAAQRFGTGAVGRLFGPVMSLWFAVIAILGLKEIVEHPGVLEALSPAFAVAFFADHPGVAFLALASVVLTVTGAEALYADLGHFGRPPIRRAWFFIVFPALTLNYLGQGSLVLHTPSAARNPFFLLVPDWGVIPMVVLATAATVIASQAVISGAFSITHQAVQLGFLPRMTVRHTSAVRSGQIYVPSVNWILFVVVAALVVGFRTSEHLSSAYGIAVTGTMAITTVLYLCVLRALRHRPLWQIVVLGAVFLTVDLAVFAASLTKLTHGGWFPLGAALVVFTILRTWERGHEILVRNRAEQEGPLDAFVEELRAAETPVTRVPGTAVFLNADRATTPLALRANVEYNHVLHRTVLILSLRSLNIPHVSEDHRVIVDDLGYSDDGITHLTARFGFRDQHDLPGTLALAARHGLERSVDVRDAAYFVTRISIERTRAPGMAGWRKRLFVALARNQANPTNYLGVPERRTVTMGSIVEI